MGLKDLVIASEVVVVPGSEQQLIVRGLGFDSFIYIFRHNRDAAEEIYAQAEKGELDAKSVEALMASTLARAPLLVAMVISCAVGEPEEWQNALLLPLSTQIEIVDKALRLTFAAEGGLGKTLETVKMALTGAAGLRKAPA